VVIYQVKGKPPACRFVFIAPPLLRPACGAGSAVGSTHGKPSLAACLFCPTGILPPCFAPPAALASPAAGVGVCPPWLPPACSLRSLRSGSLHCGRSIRSVARSPCGAPLRGATLQSASDPAFTSAAKPLSSSGVSWSLSLPRSPRLRCSPALLRGFARVLLVPYVAKQNHAFGG
jgi:hypothetical protein